ncbi:CDP-alcohol phosphatidyltransferase family protein [Ramlibacter sp. H39-3-26]|uniref:CDP-alcohol phosphatidyltransferase family protein n=1 Tax=Curvibacter soli TaxID=3031331 RepID=UPI0023DC4B0B|nr:CDP-alcohol phosphatidyltransferase family protein [Ramlibacter sp. H39-3-26]MDF1483848.1 CDP-alcohol phosphatidyltransferase family protein [Ramlibacter sp. H39-3-26]
MNLWIDTTAAARAEPLFGIPPVERLRRSVKHLDAGTHVVLSGVDAGSTAWPAAKTDVDTVPLGMRLRQALVSGALVAIDGGNAVDPRLIDVLLRGTGPCVAVRGEGAERAVVLRLEPALAGDIPSGALTLREVADTMLAAGRIAPYDEQDFPAYVNKLRRSLPYWIYAVNGKAARNRLERQMFWDNYKGSTDLLTRWVYPPLVWQLVRLCTRWRIHPNTVTALSIILTVAAVPLFAQGNFLLGFLCAYGMSVLDSVDGKIARVTLTDSAIGNVLDHGLDIVHPPFWYFAWAWGLGGRSMDDHLYAAAVWLIVFYLGDRIVLGIAKARLGFALHAATRLDGRVRSFIARRNITMTIMALALLIGAGPAGLYIVTAWQGLTFAWHGVRTIWLGFLARNKSLPAV